jgi:hypothetical protein
MPGKNPGIFVLTDEDFASLPRDVIERYRDIALVAHNMMTSRALS